MISEITRRNIFDFIRVQRIPWSGRLSEKDFLERIFELEKIPSNDSRFKNVAGDIWQHRINNPYDWEDDWIFSDSRFNLLKCDDDLFLSFLCEMLHPIVRDNNSEAENLRAQFNNFLVKDAYEIIEVSNISGYSVYAGKQKMASMPVGVSFAKSKDTFNVEYLCRQINRIEASISNDPDLAIGTSKELVETCCKTILQEQGISVDRNWDLSKIVKETYKQLKITPEDITETVKAADIIKRLLSNLATITQGIAELRNLYGTGHGKTASSKGLNSRHAKLAAGAATTLAIFLFETYESRKNDSLLLK